MTRRFSLPIIGWLLAAVAILQLFPYVASGAVGSGIRTLQLPDNPNPAVLSQNSSFGAGMVSAAQDSFQSGNPANNCEQEGEHQGGCPAGIFPPGSKPYGLSYGEWS